jgi:hypothetical protein
MTHKKPQSGPLPAGTHESTTAAHAAFPLRHRRLPRRPSTTYEPRSPRVPRGAARMRGRPGDSGRRWRLATGTRPCCTPSSNERRTATRGYWDIGGASSGSVDSRVAVATSPAQPEPGVTLRRPASRGPPCRSATRIGSWPRRSPRMRLGASDCPRDRLSKRAPLPGRAPGANCVARAQTLSGTELRRSTIPPAIQPTSAARSATIVTTFPVS